jgi:hypothetical protein
MATKKITQLDLLASGSIVAANDVLPIVGISTDVTYKTTVDDLKGGMGLAPITSNDSQVFIKESTQISEPTGTVVNLNLTTVGANSSLSPGDSYIKFGFSGSNPEFGPEESTIAKIGFSNTSPFPKVGGGIQFYTMASSLNFLPTSPDVSSIFMGMYPSDQTFRSSRGMVIGNSTPSPYGTLHIIPENWAGTFFELRPYVANFDAVNRGVKFPSVTEVSRDNMSGMEGGTVIFNETTSKLQVWTGSAWVDLH